MGRAAVQQEIARLEALSRTRALDDRESLLLQKLITTERRYDYSSAAHASRPVRGPMEARRCPCGEALGFRNRSGLCRPCSARQAMLLRTRLRSSHLSAKPRLDGNDRRDAACTAPVLSQPHPFHATGDRT